MITSLPDLLGFLKRLYRRWPTKRVPRHSPVPGDLPDGLALVYKKLGALVELGHKGPFGCHDSLVPLSRLKRIGDMVEFAWECQGNWSCRCRINQTDPAVYCDVGKYNEDGDGFRIVCKSLNHFLVSLCLLQAVSSCNHVVALDYSKDLRKLIIPKLTPLWRRGRYVWGKPVFDFFVLPRREIIIMSCVFGWPIMIGSPQGPVQDIIQPSVDFQLISE